MLQGVRAPVDGDPTTGKVKKSLPEADEATAFKWLSDERARIKAGIRTFASRKSMGTSCPDTWRKRATS